MSDRSEWICGHCGTVFEARRGVLHCGMEPEAFDLVQHKRRIVGKSNAWIQVWERWKDEVNASASSKRLYDEGCCGSGSHLNAFIADLFKP